MIVADGSPYGIAGCWIEREEHPRADEARAARATDEHAPLAAPEPERALTSGIRAGAARTLGRHGKRNELAEGMSRDAEDLRDERHRGMLDSRAGVQRTRFAALAAGGVEHEQCAESGTQRDRMSGAREKCFEDLRPRAERGEFRKVIDRNAWELDVCHATAAGERPLTSEGFD